MQTPRLPPFAAALLRRMQHGAERDEVLADMADEYASRRARDGVRARVWLWRQVLGSVPFVLRRSWFRGRTGFESEANRMRGGAPMLETWIKDARFALRSMRARPMYAALSVLTLALGIGGTAAVFGIARAVLLERLPYAASDELVMFWNMFDWSEAEVSQLRSDWTGFRGVAAYRSEGVFLRLDGGPARLVPGVASSAELFDVLGTRPLLGTGFPAGADAVGVEPTAVLSYGLWQELGGGRDIVGSSVRLDGEPRRILGVMPAGFWFPDPSVRVWLSTPMRPDNRSGNYALIGRREPGLALTAMTEPLARITSRLSAQFTYPPAWDKTKHAVLAPLRDHLLGPVRPAILATLAGMAVILLMACANVATLMLAQLRGRESELAVRLALGAGRRRLTQQLLIESVILGLISGAVGAGAAAGGFTLLLSALPLGELAHVATADWTLFAIALVLALGAAMLIALAPVFSLWFGDLRDALNRARSGGIGVRGGRLEDALVVGEVALAVLLAATAAVLIRSVDNLYAVDPGVDTRDVAVIDVTSAGDVTPDQRRQDIAQMVSTLGALPGVRSAGAIQRLPLHVRGDNWGIRFEGAADAEPSTTAYRLVTHDYFAVMGIPLKSGRWFDASDRAGSEPVIVIDEALAQKYFPGEDPLGRRIASGTGLGWMRIIGIVGNVAHDGLTDEFGPGRYMLFEQIPNYSPESTSLVMRVERGRDVGGVLHDGVTAIQQHTPTVAVQDATTMSNILALAMGPTRRVMQLMTLLGLLALTLGAIGVYGVVSHFVNRRRRDWMIKLALGMKPAAVLQQVVGRGALLVSAGCALGLLASLALTRLFTSLLYGVSPADPLALIAAAATLVITGSVAALLPGRRASRANPAAVLRES
jgi:putative ABC transport system permease protein